eukprot:Platyproteum_vivax@DN7037_c0_g1_i3.p1
MERLEKDTMPYRAPDGADDYNQDGKDCYIVIDNNARKNLNKYKKKIAAWESTKAKKRGPKPQKPNGITVPLGILVKSMGHFADLWIETLSNTMDRMNEAEKLSKEGLELTAGRIDSLPQSDKEAKSKDKSKQTQKSEKNAKRKGRQKAKKKTEKKARK